MFQKVTLQGAALILFKFCLISEAQPHSPNTTSHPIYQFPHFLILSFPHFPPIAFASQFLVPKAYDLIPFFHYLLLFKIIFLPLHPSFHYINVNLSIN